MSLYHLDPRQAGTGAPYDCETRPFDTRNNAQWHYRVPPSFATWHGPHTDEQSALRAAREAAGFGDVAEQPCAQFVSFAGFDDTSTDPSDDCTTCRWSRDAHGKGRTIVEDTKRAARAHRVTPCDCKSCRNKENNR